MPVTVSFWVTFVHSGGLPYIPLGLRCFITQVLLFSRSKERTLSRKGKWREWEGEGQGGRTHKISTIYRTYDVTQIEYSLVKVDSRRPEQQGAFGKPFLIYFYTFKTLGKSIIGYFK